MIYTADNHQHTTQELARRNIPFREVTLHTGSGPKKALDINTNALIIIMAGAWLTDN